MGRKLIYTDKTFKKVKRDKWFFIEGNAKSIKTSAYKWAKDKGIQVNTMVEANGLWIKEKSL